MTTHPIRVSSTCILLAACAACSGESAAPTSAQSVSAGASPFFAISSDQTSLYKQSESYAKQAANLKGLGIRMVRVQLCDWPAQKQQMDDMVNAFRAADLLVYGELNYCTVKGSPSDWHADFVDLGQGNAYAKSFAKAAGEMAAHFSGRVAYWEIWNEPDSPPNGGEHAPDWDGACGGYAYGPADGWGVCPKQLGVITANAFVKIHAADPNARVVAGNLLFHGQNNWVGREYWRHVYTSKVVQDYRKQHGRFPWDVVGIHPYNWEADQPEWTTVLDQFQAVLDDNGDGSPLAITEYGIQAGSAVSAARQAALVPLTYSFAKQRGYEFVVWFNYRDDPGAGLHMGIRRPDGSWKPAADAFCTITGQKTCTTGNPVKKPPSITGDVGKEASGGFSPGIADCWQRNGGQQASGLPFDNGGSKYVHSWGPGKVQDYAGGSLGPNLCMRKLGSPIAWMVRGGIRQAYFAAGGGEGPLGYPKNEEYASPSGPRQDFEHGYVTWDHGLGAFRAFQ